MAIGRTDEQETPLGAKAIACRIRVWGLFGETHLGQRSCRHRVKGRTHDRTRSERQIKQKTLALQGPFSNRASYVNRFRCCHAGVTVLSAVDVCRRNIWSEAQALQCPQRAHTEYMRPNGLPRSLPAPSPRWATRTRATLPRGWISSRFAQASTACSDQRNGSPDRQMLCRITDSLRASATRALAMPERFAMASAQSFKRDARFTRVKITTAASYSSVRASVSPHREILPLRSTSPD